MPIRTMQIGPLLELPLHPPSQSWSFQTHTARIFTPVGLIIAQLFRFVKHYLSLLINISFALSVTIIIETKRKDEIMILNIADRIKYLRDKADLTQTDLARALGISRSAVNSWEMSLSTPSLSNIVEMTKIFHINADYLLGANDKIFADITELSNEEREIVLRLIECLKKK